VHQVMVVKTPSGISVTAEDSPRAGADCPAVTHVRSDSQRFGPERSVVLVHQPVLACEPSLPALPGKSHSCGI
jgi:hypothetical protein